MTARVQASDKERWWDIDDEVLRTLHGSRPMGADELAQKLGVSESAAASLVAMLVLEGRVRIRAVEVANVPADL